MKVHQADSYNYLLQLLEAQQSSQSGSTSTTTQSTSSNSANVSTDSASVSDPAQLFKELEQLSSSNPAEFKKISASIAQQLTAAAKNSTDPGQAAALNSLAANFTKASQSGSFSDLFSQQNGASGSHGVPPPPPSGTDAYSSSSDSEDAVEKIFAQALKQIQSDLGTTSTSSSSASGT